MIRIYLVDERGYEEYAVVNEDRYPEFLLEPYLVSMNGSLRAAKKKAKSLSKLYGLPVELNIVDKRSFQNTMHDGLSH
jgi:hypothetical protein